MTAPERLTGSDSVSYLRVSSQGQLKTDYNPEGQSIPSQRTACKQRARDVDSVIVAEFVDPGRSATTMNKRVEFQELLSYVKEHANVKYVIVYSLSRMARNRYDDAILMVSLDKLGVTLLSATERNLDSTPAGKAMHGMIAVFNQYQSDASGADIKFKMGQKVTARGGALGSACVGYKNVRDITEGREVRTIAIDHDRDRAALVRESFELYATGDHTIDTAWPLMIERGLVMRATPSKPELPISRGGFGDMLRNRFYIGETKYKGQWYPGRHEPLISLDLFDRVQRILDNHSGAGVRNRKLNHYLKGIFWCNRCGHRMLYAQVKEQYEYYFCHGTKLVGCDQPYVPVDTLERELLRHYSRAHLKEQFRAEVAAMVNETVHDEQLATAQVEARITKRLGELEAQEDRYLDLLGDPDWPQEKLKTKLNTVRRERASVSGQLAQLQGTLDAGRQVLSDAVQLLAEPQALYQQLADPERRLMSLMIFGKLKIDNRSIVDHELQQPFTELLDVQQRRSTPDAAAKSYQRLAGRLDPTWQATFDDLAADMNKGTLRTEGAFDWNDLTSADLLELALGGQSSRKAAMVETQGLEPWTPCLQSRCSSQLSYVPKLYDCLLTCGQKGTEVFYLKNANKTRVVTGR
jgi:site-specific DNA recombinase